MLDSTYIVPSDPNTMRDLGRRIGNVEYQFLTPNEGH
jgi:hypothetical protein